MKINEHKFAVMELEDAQNIVNWSYEPPYSLYNMSNTDEDIAELMDGTYFSVKDDNNLLIGFVCFGNNAQVKGGKLAALYDDPTATDIGIGLRPDLTGQGRGKVFFNATMLFGKAKFNITKYRLTVATFNERAIATYHSTGFKQIGQFINDNNDTSMPFIVMITE